MEVLVIGDIHGLETWKQLVSDEYDKIIFMGDYFDSFDIDSAAQVNNFLDILKYKESNEKVELLTGNHDFQYFPDFGERYSGRQSGVWPIKIREVLKSAPLKMCHIHDNFLFTHAGVTKTWCEENQIDTENLEQSINDRHKYKSFSFCFVKLGPGGRFSNPYGNDIFQSPIWVREKSLHNDGLPGYHQIVGHTPQSLIRKERNVTFVDCLPHQCLIIEDGKQIVYDIDLQTYDTI